MTPNFLLIFKFELRVAESSLLFFTIEIQQQEAYNRFAYQRF